VVVIRTAMVKIGTARRPLQIAMAAHRDSGTFDSDTVHSDGADGGIPDICTALNEANDMLLCTHEMSDKNTWDTMTVASSRIDQVALTKYVMGADESMPVPLSFMNVNIHRLHYDFLLAAFPDFFNSVSPVGYLKLAMADETRPLMVGTITLFVADDEQYYGFTVLDSGASEDVVSYEQVQHVHRELSARFTLGELTFVPETPAQIEAAAKWHADFPIAGLDPEVDYEVYTIGEGVGTISAN
jgi:hypothetical protein